MARQAELIAVQREEGDIPLAERLRPASWEDFRGLEALDKNLVARLKKGEGRPPSLILWGPPGCGKTTLAKIIGKTFDADFVQFSAVLGGVKEVREIVEQAKASPRATILFVDEIHRFNKGQQDAFLPHVENGTIVLIGATTENPSFALTGALLSRCKVVSLGGVNESALKAIANHAATTLGISFDECSLKILTEVASGDARKLLNLIEQLVSSERFSGKKEIEGGALEEFLKDAKTLFYDRSDDQHYQMASAFIKSMRGSDPDAALYWGFRMMESGEDPRFIIRRLIIFASEDIGNADPRALPLATATSDAYERVGLPEGRIPIAQCITYLASCPKSNRSYMAMHRAIVAIRQHPRVNVPLHLRNAPTGLMKSMGYGADYQYPHDNEEGYAPGVQYLPDELKGERFYEPKSEGLERSILERLQQLRAIKKS